MEIRRAAAFVSFQVYVFLYSYVTPLVRNYYIPEYQRLSFSHTHFLAEPVTHAKNVVLAYFRRGEWNATAVATPVNFQVSNFFRPTTKSPTNMVCSMWQILLKLGRCFCTPYRAENPEETGNWATTARAKFPTSTSTIQRLPCRRTSTQMMMRSGIR